MPSVELYGSALPPEPPHTTGLARNTSWVPDVERVESVGELFHIRSLATLFRHGMIFIHYKRPLADKLISIAGKELVGQVKFRHFDTATTETASLLPDPKARASGAWPCLVPVIDANGPAERTERIVTAYSELGNRRGLWLKGHLEDLRASTLCRFDALFLFDMPEQYLSRIASSILIQEDASELLKGAMQRDGRGNESVFVAILARKIRKQRMPTLEPRPPVLKLAHRGRPVAEEAVKSVSESWK